MATLGFREIAAELSNRIQSGEWAPGAQVPSESELVAEFGVSRTTMRRALDALQKDGRLETVAGRGRFVSSGGVPQGQAKYERILGELRSEAEALNEGHAWRTAELATRFDVAPGTIRQALQILTEDGCVTPVRGRGWVIGAESKTTEVVNKIRSAIDAGEFMVGGQLPGERELANRFDVARITARRAIEVLEIEGVLQKRSGKGRLITGKGVSG